MKLSTSVRRTREAAKSLKIGTNGMEIEANKEDCTTADAKGIIPLLRAFHVYTQILIFLAAVRWENRHLIFDVCSFFFWARSVLSKLG